MEPLNRKPIVLRHPEDLPTYSQACPADFARDVRTASRIHNVRARFAVIRHQARGYAFRQREELERQAPPLPAYSLRYTVQLFLAMLALLALGGLLAYLLFTPPLLGA